jgi:hypothetical protein
VTTGEENNKAPCVTAAKACTLGFLSRAERPLRSGLRQAKALIQSLHSYSFLDDHPIALIVTRCLPKSPLIGTGGRRTLPPRSGLTPSSPTSPAQPLGYCNYGADKGKSAYTISVSWCTTTKTSAATTIEHHQQCRWLVYAQLTRSQHLRLARACSINSNSLLGLARQAPLTQLFPFDP